MRALKPLSSLPLAAAALALVLGSSALAQRRVLTAPGTKPPAPSTTEPGKPAGSDASGDQATAGAGEEGAADDASVPASVKAKRAKAKEAQAAPPKMLQPKDESAPAAKSPTAAAPATPVNDVLYRKKVDRNVITLRVRPAQPVPHRSTTLQFEILKVLPSPDPTYGDRMPLLEANLFATITEMVPNGLVTRYRLHRLKDAGAYGTNITVAKAGLYRIEVEQILDEEHIGDRPLKADFTLGIGQQTPMAVVEDNEDEANVEARRGRQALKAKVQKEGGPSETMRLLGERWMDLVSALDRTSSPEEREALAREIVDLAARAQGTVPPSMVATQAEYDALAGALQTAVKDLPTTTADAKACREAMGRIENESCLKCHARYRFRITDNVSGWPRFTPKSPDAATSAQ